MKMPRSQNVTEAAHEEGDERQSPRDGDRLAMIAEAAYFRAERRGFQGSGEEATRDWLEAEREIDALLAQRPLMLRESTESAARPSVSA